MTNIPAGTTAAIVRPGDTLILTFTQPLSPQDRNDLRSEIRPGLDGVKVMLLDCVAGLAVYQPNPTPAPSSSVCAQEPDPVPALPTPAALAVSQSLRLRLLAHLGDAWPDLVGDAFLDQVVEQVLKVIAPDLDVLIRGRHRDVEHYRTRARVAEALLREFVADTTCETDPDGACVHHHGGDHTAPGEACLRERVQELLDGLPDPEGTTT